MTYSTVWSLKQWNAGRSGIIWPPRPLPQADQDLMYARDSAIQFERDWSLTQREFHQEEVARGFRRRRSA